MEISGPARCMGSGEGDSLGREGELLLLLPLLVLLLSAATATSITRAGLSQQ